MQKINLTNQEVAKLKSESCKRYFQSGFNFLNEHKDLRPGKNHLFVAKPSGGKSTLRTSLIKNLLEYNDNISIFLYLSEESINDLKSDLAHLNSVSDINNRLVAYSEIENLADVKDQEFGLSNFYQLALKSCADVLIFDNVTTSKLYMGTPSFNDTFASAMKNNLINLDIPGIFLAHTDSKVGNIIDINNFRGSRTFVNLAEFQYTLDSVDSGRDTKTVLRIWKHRGQNIKNKYFLLPFDFKTRCYGLDKQLSYEDIANIYKTRNKI